MLALAFVYFPFTAIFFLVQAFVDCVFAVDCYVAITYFVFTVHSRVSMLSCVLSSQAASLYIGFKPCNGF